MFWCIELQGFFFYSYSFYTIILDSDAHHIIIHLPRPNKELPNSFPSQTQQLKTRLWLCHQICQLYRQDLFVVFEITHFPSVSVLLATSTSFSSLPLASVILVAKTPVPNLTRCNNGRCQAPILHKGRLKASFYYFI